MGTKYAFQGQSDIQNGNNITNDGDNITYVTSNERMNTISLSNGKIT